MKYNVEKKLTIKKYLLEKIQQKENSISKKVSETFGINPSTVHSYINEMMKDEIIRKVKRDEYEIVCHENLYELSRSNGDLDSDTYAFDVCMLKHIKEYEKNVQDIWAYAFSEMINNVMDHSMAEDVKVIIRQDYLNTTAIIIDNGVGIFKKIMEYFKLNSMDEAICELFKGKLTTDAKNHSGEGIFFSSKLMDDFFILSSGKIFTNNKYDDSKIINLAQSEESGTCVVMELSNYSNKTANEVFRVYENDDGGFVKTKIPLKNIFESSPVSRSQAKRVCDHLEKFKEVVIDFEGITWMGQGFAHQLFSIFQNNNPEIKITPINMNEEITRMYNHVRN